MAPQTLRPVLMLILSRIYLTGFMGSGKSTLGPGLADALDYAFVDLDEYIEQRAGQPIQEIFEQQSERNFRELEAEALATSFDWTKTVVALGGGALATEEAMERALRKGLVVYLYASEETMIERAEQSGKMRPLLTQRNQVKALLAAREPVYRRAHVIFSTEGISIIQASEGLLAAVESSRQNNRRG